MLRSESVIRQAISIIWSFSMSNPVICNQKQICNTQNHLSGLFYPVLFNSNSLKHIPFISHSQDKRDNNASLASPQDTKHESLIQWIFTKSLPYVRHPSSTVGQMQSQQNWVLTALNLVRLLTSLHLCSLQSFHINYTSWSSSQSNVESTVITPISYIKKLRFNRGGSLRHEYGKPKGIRTGF